TSRLSVFNMMEAVFAPAFPAALGKLVVVNLYEIEGGREPYWERVQVADSDGQILAQSVTELVGEGTVHRSMALFQGILLAKTGEYAVVVAGSRRRDGPWELVRRRRLQALLGPHPMARPEQGDAKLPAATEALTE
ncbi:MAG TPA: hypothetical protein VMK12_05025, partial [Anaeromyxobacteraceae bacterium]|nr:hypothetical protein [Anaeromyxobacteraceae bacterium]